MIIPLRQETEPRTPVRLKVIRPVFETLTVSCALAEYLSSAPPMHQAEDVRRLFEFLEGETRESFWAVHLNAKNQIVCVDQVSVGSLTASIVHPREVFKSALLTSAAALIFVHNHPQEIPHRAQKTGRFNADWSKPGSCSASGFSTT